MTSDVFKEVDHYIASLLAQENSDMLNARLLIQQANLPDQSISPVQGKLLQVLASSCGSKRILELGTFGAYSTLWLANILPPDGTLITIEYDPFHAQIARQTINSSIHSKQIELRTGRALEILEEMIQKNMQPFDFIFIDADKTPYLEYFKMALKLSRKGSMIVCDNVIRNGLVLDASSNDEKVQGVQRLNNYLSTCKEVTATLLQTVGEKEYDGMVLAVVQ